jgi:hypothetical protein
MNFDDLGTPTSGTPERGSTPDTPMSPESPVIELDAEVEGPSSTQPARGGRPPLPRRQSNRSKA